MKFQSGAGGLTLLIQAPGPAAALIEAQGAQIIERVAHFTGRAPKRLKVTQSAGPRRRAAPAAEPARIRKVRAFSAEPEGLDAVMAEFEAAVTTPKSALDKRS